MVLSVRTYLTRVLLAAQLLLLAACSAVGTPAPATSAPPDQNLIATLVASAMPSPTADVTPTGLVPDTGLRPQDDTINPLTGLPAPDPALLDRRPVMVKVSNFPVVGRPHAGLSFADMVFEYYIGEYINRFLAIYYSQDAPKVGPVRSGRLADVQLVRMFQGVLAYGSADERVDQSIKQYLGIRSLAHTESPCPPICGFDPHSAAGTFADTASLSAYMTKIGVENVRQDLTGLTFNPTPPANSQPAVQLAVQYATFNRGEWRYDPGSGKYLRWIEEMDADNNRTMIPLVDRLTDQQLGFSNVVVLFAFYVEYNRTLHNIDIWNNTAGKRALFFRDGVLTEGLWKTVDKERPMQFFDQNGQPYALKPGNTWVVINGLSSTFDQPQPGQFETHFFLP
jgi:hypothetical protein